VLRGKIRDFGWQPRPTARIEGNSSSEKERGVGKLRTDSNAGPYVIRTRVGQGKALP